MEANRLGARKGITLLVDTNMLMLIAKGVITPTHIMEALEASYTILVPESVLVELERLARSPPNPSTARIAKRALELLSSRRIKYTVVESRVPGSVDDDLISLSIKMKSSGVRVIVATSDRGLRRRLRSHGVPTLYYRESEGLLEADWLPP